MVIFFFRVTISARVMANFEVVAVISLLMLLLVVINMAMLDQSDPVAVSQM